VPTAKTIGYDNTTRDGDANRHRARRIFDDVCTGGPCRGTRRQNWYADPHHVHAEGAMAAKEISKKKYLKILNKRLRAEPAAPAGASFVFFPLGAKAKNATGVVSGDTRSKRELAVMAAVQRRAAEEFVVAGA